MSGEADRIESFERLMARHDNSDRLREAFLKELLQSDWKEQVISVVGTLFENNHKSLIFVGDRIFLRSKSWFLSTSRAEIYVASKSKTSFKMWHPKLPL